MQACARFVQQAQNDAFAQRRHIGHVANRRANQDTDRTGFSSHGWLPDLAACSEITDRPMLTPSATLTTGASLIWSAAVVNEAEMVPLPASHSDRIAQTA